MEERTEKERTFSVELESRSDLKNVSMTNGAHGGNVLVEGTIGGLRAAGFAEGVLLEVVGSKGVLRIDLKENEVGKNGTGAMEEANK
jgi:hypothetical protein